MNMIAVPSVSNLEREQWEPSNELMESAGIEKKLLQFEEHTTGCSNPHDSGLSSEVLCGASTEVAAENNKPAGDEGTPVSDESSNCSDFLFDQNDKSRREEEDLTLCTDSFNHKGSVLRSHRGSALRAKTAEPTSYRTPSRNQNHSPFRSPENGLQDSRAPMTHITLEASHIVSPLRSQRNSPNSTPVRFSRQAPVPTGEPSTVAAESDKILLELKLSNLYKEHQELQQKFKLQEHRSRNILTENQECTNERSRLRNVISHYRRILKQHQQQLQYIFLAYPKIPEQIREKLTAITINRNSESDYVVAPHKSAEDSQDLNSLILSFGDRWILSGHHIRSFEAASKSQFEYERYEKDRGKMTGFEKILEAEKIVDQRVSPLYSAPLLDLDVTNAPVGQPLKFDARVSRHRAMAAFIKGRGRYPPLPDLSGMETKSGESLEGGPSGGNFPKKDSSQVNPAIASSLEKRKSSKVYRSTFDLPLPQTQGYCISVPIRPPLIARQHYVRACRLEKAVVHLKRSVRYYGQKQEERQNRKLQRRAEKDKLKISDTQQQQRRNSACNSSTAGDATSPRRPAQMTAKALEERLKEQHEQYARLEEYSENLRKKVEHVRRVFLETASHSLYRPHASLDTTGFYNLLKEPLPSMPGQQISRFRTMPVDVRNPEVAPHSRSISHYADGGRERSTSHSVSASRSRTSAYPREAERYSHMHHPSLHPPHENPHFASSHMRNNEYENAPTYSGHSYCDNVQYSYEPPYMSFETEDSHKSETERNGLERAGRKGVHRSITTPVKHIDNSEACPIYRDRNYADTYERQDNNRLRRPSVSFEADGGNRKFSCSDEGDSDPAQYVYDGRKNRHLHESGQFTDARQNILREHYGHHAYDHRYDTYNNTYNYNAYANVPRGNRYHLQHSHGGNNTHQPIAAIPPKHQKRYSDSLYR